uniref:Regulatory protein n=1 Tax=Siphoviridae sp. ctBeL15 TaxID=2825374 RepID=A0A8S5UZV5_9CAUD|nr:MAG TPA: regulatory protein [Siphoviridae sp. ctBeL15]
MNELSIIHKNGVDVIDSREVAEVIGKEHRHLIRDIRNYVEILEKATEPKVGLSENPSESNEPNFGLVEKSTAGTFSLSDFFIPHIYTDSKGEQRPCYLLTKKGCDMVANKMTGEKGVLFTAAYVTAFEKMRETAYKPKPMSTNDLFELQVKINREYESKLNALEERAENTDRKISTITDVFAAPPTDEERWRDEMNRRVRAMCEEYGLNYHTTIGEMYAELERRAHVNLATRQKNLRERMRLGGAKYAQREAVSKLVVISQDAKLRYIYEAIVREKAAQLAASRMR